MNHQYKTKAFKELQKDWYKRLTDSGFEDIEDTDSPMEFLKTWHSSYFQRRHTPESFEITQDYFMMATTYFDETDLSDLERSCWDLHARGLTIREIAEKIHKHRSTVFRTIERLSTTMKAGLK